MAAGQSSWSPPSLHDEQHKLSVLEATLKYSIMCFVVILGTLLHLW